IEDHISLDDEPSVVKVIAKAKIDLTPQPPGLRVLLDGRDVTEQIRSPEVTLAAARISRLPGVRAKLVGLQRSFVREPGVVMEGRDIGTVVFPDAALKVFLTAHREERARRRLSDEAEKGWDVTLEQTAYEIGRRDQLDAERKVSPLLPALNAFIIDSTELTARQVVDRIIEVASENNISLKGSSCGEAEP
ncbi:MAG: (d)CMP kinase, partial [Terriglobia bacterium]